MHEIRTRALIERLDTAASDDGHGVTRLGCCDVSMRLIPQGSGELSGDWCETFNVSEDVIAFSIGDVSGHGNLQHETACMLRDRVKRAAQAGEDPALALRRANRMLIDSDADKTATAVLALFDGSRRVLRFASAGHPPPIMVGPQGASFLEFQEADLPLGILEASEPRTHEQHLPHATLLLLYTDGVIERDRKPLQGMADLLNAAIFAYNFSRLPTASVVERQMLLTGENPDDAAILAVWTPPQ